MLSLRDQIRSATWQLEYIHKTRGSRSDSWLVSRAFPPHQLPRSTYADRLLLGQYITMRSIPTPSPSSLAQARTRGRRTYVVVQRVASRSPFARRQFAR